ncbi:MAG: DUF1178 family protein [Hyphomonadaceae bacterium]|nr:DUF1178 family protein [Hyphomonadaceae bacterium]
MIRYDLQCENGDAFDAWFGNSSDFDRLAAQGLVECPHCGSKAVAKAPMAPAIIRRRRRAPDGEKAPEKVTVGMAKQLREHIRDNYDYVGERFPEEARKMHDGEAEHRAIWGEASPEEAKQMLEDGLPVAPLPSSLAPIPPKKVN